MNVVNVPPNPDNQIEATVTQEVIRLPRKSVRCFPRRDPSDFVSELTKTVANLKASLIAVNLHTSSQTVDLDRKVSTN